MTTKQATPRLQGQRRATPAVRLADRLQRLPPYLFAELDRAKRQAREAGRDVIDFGVGDPDLPTPPHIIEALTRAARDPANHRYALDQGLPELRQAIAGWYQRRFNVRLDPETEILPLLGSKEGIAHAPLAFLNPNDVALVPDPCYPPYRSGTILAGGVVHPLPLREANHFLPELGEVPAAIRRRAKLLFANYPNNPTAGVATRADLARLLTFAAKHGMILCYDAAYSELAFDGCRPPSILELPGARECAIEFHSLSKTYQMTGWRIGWACGNPQILAALSRVKSNIDSGIFQAVQHAGIAALTGSQRCVTEAVQEYQRRCRLLVEGLAALGWQVAKPQATFYLWAKVPACRAGAGRPRRGMSSALFAKQLLDEVSIVVTPGSGFGPSGEGYVRLALTIPVERIRQALDRLRSWL